MAQFIRENIGIILIMVIVGIVVLGGIYYVETALESQVIVVD
ncbi:MULTISPECIES: hypothetical protein [Shewanella]|jgi:hypothetical protein|uniref:Uncharacterized protein n=1 Tax=Shewanella metallivivens TaxID=2872342 RepID=A0ABT5TN50_9GAMM|nr:hypothetical protein [Shewanella metallivivens]MDD8060020.1 hypothetical protein [Shewanella metallivivens]